MPIMSLEKVGTSLLRVAGGLASGKDTHAALAVLIFHRVLPEPDPLIPSEPDAKRFKTLVDSLTQCFNILPLSEAVSKLKDGCLPKRTLCITFDDGYANNCTVALPILSAYRTPATVFVAPGFLNGGIMFNDIIIETVRRCGSQLDLRSIELGYFDLRDIPSRINAIEQIISKLKHQPVDKRAATVKKLSQYSGVTLPTDLMMSDTQVQHLNKQGIEIGAHTVNHPILTSTEASVANCEIRQSKAYLESLLNKTVTSFAYPNGRPHQDYACEHVKMVKDAGFKIALSTAWGTASKDSDIFQIPRLAPWDSSTRKYTLRILRGYRQRSFITV